MADKFPFELVTPNRLLVSEDVDMVVVPGGDGDFGVLPGHAPLLSTVRPGTVEVHEDGKVTARFFVEGGFAEVTPGRCTVLAETAAPVSELTSEAANDRIATAKEALDKADGETARRDAERDLLGAEAMLVAVETRERSG